MTVLIHHLFSLSAMLTKVQVPMEGPYDQFMLFGDSLFQQSCSQEAGFAFCPALQDGMTRLLNSSPLAHTRFLYHYLGDSPILIVDCAR